MSLSCKNFLYKVSIWNFLSICSGLYSVLSLLPKKDSKFYRVALGKDAAGVGGKAGRTLHPCIMSVTWERISMLTFLHRTVSAALKKCCVSDTDRGTLGPVLCS